MSCKCHRRRRHCGNIFSCKAFRKRAKKTRVAGFCCPSHHNIFTRCHH